MASPGYFPRQSDALIDNWLAGKRPETMSAYQEPWYRALPPAAGLGLLGTQNQPQNQQVQ